MFGECRRPPALRDAQLSLGGQSQQLIQAAGAVEVGEASREGSSILTQDELGLHLPREANNTQNTDFTM